MDCLLAELVLIIYSILKLYHQQLIIQLHSTEISTHFYQNTSSSLQLLQTLANLTDMTHMSFSS